jgi:hypothetical protein
MVIIFQEHYQKGFLGPWVERENYSWPEGRKIMDYSVVEESSGCVCM